LLERKFVESVLAKQAIPLGDCSKIVGMVFEQTNQRIRGLDSIKEVNTYEQMILNIS